MDYEGHEEEFEIETYEEEIIEMLNKALTDEISAASAYLCMAEMTENATLASELSAHALEEFTHYKRIISFIYAHGLELVVDFTMDLDVANDFPNETYEIIDFVQELEKEAIEDYREIALLARDNDDIETEEFFTSLMKEEQAHYDELARYNGERRTLKSFRDYVEY